MLSSIEVGKSEAYMIESSARVASLLAIYIIS